MRSVRLLLFVAICVAMTYGTDKDLPDFADQILEKSDLLNPKGGSKFKEKKEKFKESAKTAKNAFLKLGKDEVASGIKDVGEGLTQLVSGISSGSWQDMLLGGLSLVGTLVSFAGPMGAAFSTVLSLVSMAFGLFGGSKEAEESQEGMLKRVIDEALTRAQADELRAEAEGLKKAVSSIRNSINQFREENSTTQDQATELYNQAFRGLNFFGQLKFYIDKYCVCSVENLQVEKLKVARKNSDRCLEFLNLYSDLSILRQLLIADMASLVGSVGLNGTARNLLSLTEKEKNSDKDILLFLLDPINNKQQRFCITQYFGSPGKYPTIRAYLKSLTSVSTGQVATKQVVICSQKELLGICYKIEPNESEMKVKKVHEIKNLENWRESVHSLFISEGLEVTGFSDENFGGDPYGPFRGPTVLGKIRGGWKSIKISPNELKTEYIRACLDDNLIQDEYCYVFPINNYTDLCKVYGPAQNWQMEFRSIYIPENIEALFYNDKNYQGKEYGPFYGPITIDRHCDGKSTQSMKIFKSDKKSSEMVKICRGTSFSSLCVFLDIGNYSNLIIYGCYFNNSETNIKSMNVPAGIAVYMWSDESFSGKPFGPYVGPVSVPVADGGDKNDDPYIIKSLKIVRYNPLSVNSTKKKHRKRKI